jgi:hypothetical protein
MDTEPWHACVQGPGWRGLLLSDSAACAQEPDTEFMTDALRELQKGRENRSGATNAMTSSALSLEDLLQQLSLAQAEWLKSQGVAGTCADASALERAVRDRGTTASALADLVTAGA